MSKGQGPGRTEQRHVRTRVKWRETFSLSTAGKMLMARFLSSSFFYFYTWGNRG